MIFLNVQTDNDVSVKNAVAREYVNIAVSDTAVKNAEVERIDQTLFQKPSLQPFNPSVKLLQVPQFANMVVSEVCARIAEVIEPHAPHKTASTYPELVRRFCSFFISPLPKLGSQICEHMRQRNTCKACGGSSICEHGRRRNTCKECGGELRKCFHHSRQQF